jgi:dihydropteroate synthase-like protein
MTQQPEQIHFVTGRLAERPLTNLLTELAPQIGFQFSIDVLPITVAALMSPRWIARHARVPLGTEQVMIPGYCQGDLSELETALGVPVVRGPRDLRQLRAYFGSPESVPGDYGDYSIEILAEINHAPRLTRDTLLEHARSYAQLGADIIDVGCEPGDPWRDVGDAVKALRDAGFRVSIDSFHTEEIRRATAAGAELVLSVNSSNREAAADWGCEVVVIPDELSTLGGLDASIRYLREAGVSFRIDPVLEPIGFGFAASLQRYGQVRASYPDSPMLMGVGNLTEMTDADSAAINVLLLGFCQELSIHSVLTTQVIHWAQTSVRECDLARRLVHYAVKNRVPPKHLEPQLVLLRDKLLPPMREEEIEQLAGQIKDHNFRIFVSGDKIHVLSAGLNLADRDPFALMRQLEKLRGDRISTSHMFYLGHEMAKAEIAIQLGKEYRQDNPLEWGYLTDDRH